MKRDTLILVLSLGGAVIAFALTLYFRSGAF